MRNIKFKRIAASLVLAVFLSVQSAPLAYAATDDEAALSAQTGVEYLETNQNDDGSIAGFGGETEWAVIAVEAADEDAANIDNGSGESMEDFLSNDTPTSDAAATTVERKILAIAASGKDTEYFGGYNYNEKLATYHIDDQIGDTTLLNDDIFGIIAIKATDDADLTDMAQDGLDYLIAHQGVDGGFSYTTDTCGWCGSDSNDTAAAIIALDAAEKMLLSHPELISSKDFAIVYLLSTQNDDGGFGYDIFSDSDGSSTAWALMALNVIGESVRNQAFLARDWLLANQNNDGGFSYGAFGIDNSDTYTTSHAVIALLGSSWLLDPTPNSVPQTGEPDGNSLKSNDASSSNNENQSSQNVVTASASQASMPPVEEQVASAADSSTPAPNSNTGQPQANDSTKLNFGLLGIGALVYFAIMYFVLESLKARKIS